MYQDDFTVTDLEMTQRDPFSIPPAVAGATPHQQMQNHNQLQQMPAVAGAMPHHGGNMKPSSPKIVAHQHRGGSHSSTAASSQFMQGGQIGFGGA